jgi:crotonobetainyl-CoA:carnitine CoA-transferase CaiB-like acyl-CoA transferase
VKQFRPGAMENFNLSFDAVRKPNIIIFHRLWQWEIKKDAAGHDLNYMAETGCWAWIDEQETSTQVSLADIAEVVYVGFCLHQRTCWRKEWKAPQYIDVSLFDATVALGAIAQGLQGKADYNKCQI